MAADSMSHDGVPMEVHPHWEPWTPADVASRLNGVGSRWYVVAGWAIDLFLGCQTREHEDIEIGTPASDFASIRAALSDLECEVVGSIGDGDGFRWPLESPAFHEHFQTWFRDRGSGAYRLDVFRDPHEGDTWLCRRDTTIRLPYDRVIMATPDGIPYLSPEIVLLFKAKHCREKDQADFDHVLSHLTSDQCAWLHAALELVHPGHVWLAAL